MSETNRDNLEERFEAGINAQTLHAKIRRRTPLTGDETRRIVNVLKRHHPKTVA